MSEFNYLHLDYQPDYNKEIIAQFLVGVKEGCTLEETAAQIAAESSIGTWTYLETLSQETFNELGAKVFSINKETGRIKIAYNEDTFENGSLPQLMSAIGGNIFGMSLLDSLRLEDISFPPSYIKSFPGPQFGVEEGSFAKIGVTDRPLVGSIVKPKVGLTSDQQAQVAAEVFRNGVDIIKDDENLTSLPFNKLKERVWKVLKKKKEIEKETGQKKIYVFNVTGPVETIVKRAKFVKEQGGRCVMIDIITSGWAAVQHLRNQNLNLIIHAHRAGHAAFTRSKKHGISMLVVSKLARLAGVDQLHTGTVVGKMEGSREEVTTINEFLNKEWAGLKKVVPVSSGGLHPGLVPELVNLLGDQIIINFGGGIHGHPDGSGAGARAARQAVEATQEGLTLSEKAAEAPALKKAIEYWLN